MSYNESITIGGSGSITTIGGSLTSGGFTSTGSISAPSGGLTIGGLISANGGLTIGGNNNITLGNGTIAPSSTQLGCTLGGSFTNSTTLTGSPMSINSFQIVSPGTYLLSFCYQIQTATYPQAYITIYSGATSGLCTTAISSNYGYTIVIASAYISLCGVLPIVVTTPNLYYTLRLYYSLGTILSTTGTFTAIRLA